MRQERLALVLVDISGYTKFVTMRTMSLLHAESIITDLLEAVIDNAEFPLTLSKLEGDAAFLYSVMEPGTDDRAHAADILQQVDAFFAAFEAKAQELIGVDACRCEACSNIPMLKLKCVLHAGDAVIKKIRQFEEVAGEGVILTDAFFALSGGFSGRTPESRVEPCEGLAPVNVKVYYHDPSPQPLPARPAPMPPIPGTWYGNTAIRWSAHAVARALGRPPKEFSHLPQTRFSAGDLYEYFVTGLGGNVVTIAKYWFGRRSG